MGARAAKLRCQRRSGCARGCDSPDDDSRDGRRTGRRSRWRGRHGTMMVQRGSRNEPGMPRDHARWAALRKDGELVILESLWRLIGSQVNKLANFFWASDPLALMQAEYDSAVAQLREGRLGLEQYRAFVERVGRQVVRQEAQARMLEATVKTYLQTGDRET